MQSEEGPVSAFDGSAETKWHTQWDLSNFYSTHPVVSLTLSRAIEISGYIMGSANDFSQRDPSFWYVLAAFLAVTSRIPESNPPVFFSLSLSLTFRQFAVRNGDSERWRVVDERSEHVFQERFQMVTFGLKEPVVASQFQWNITGLADPYDVHCSHRFCTQMSELRLLPVNKADESVLPNGPLQEAEEPRGVSEQGADNEAGDAPGRREGRAVEEEEDALHGDAPADSKVQETGDRAEVKAEGDRAEERAEEQVEVKAEEKAEEAPNAEDEGAAQMREDAQL